VRRLAASLAVLLAACTADERAGRIEGRIAWQGRGIALALVQAYPKPEQDRSTTPVAEAPSDEQGRYRLAVPPGRYWVWAKATAADGAREARLVGEAQANPLTVGAGTVVSADIELSDPSGFARAGGPAGTGVTGRVEGTRPQEVTIYAYAGASPRPVGPGFVAAVPADGDGGFRLDLRPGTYTLAARRRATGKDFGTLAPGDEVTARSVEVEDGTYRDVGVLTMRPLDPEVWDVASRGPAPTGTAVGGVVLDGNGTPVPGVRVLAFIDPRMAGKPVALSAPTDVTGGYVVHLPAAGTYFLGARSRLGGPAEPGERIGSFRGEDGTGVKISRGQTMTGVRIQVEEVW